MEPVNLHKTYFTMFSIQIFVLQTPPATYRRQIDIHYGSLPRQQFIGNGTSVTSVDSNANPAASGARKGVAFGRGFSSLLGGRARGHSVPNLGDSSRLGMTVSLYAIDH